MSTLHAVTLTYTVIVRAETRDEATRRARDQAQEIVRNDPDPDMDYHQEISDVSQLSSFGWASHFLPYGDSDGTTTVGEYLARGG